MCVYGYPIEDAAKIAVREVREFFSPEEGAEEMEVIFCCFSERDKNVYEDLPYTRQLKLAELREARINIRQDRV